MKKIILLLILQICSWGVLSQSPFSIETLQEDLESALKDRLLAESKRFCAFPLGDERFKWRGTPGGVEHIQNNHNAVFTVDYDAGLRGKEVLITLDFIAGGTQQDFEALLNDYLENADPNKVEDFSGQIVTKLDIDDYNLNPKVTFWNCERTDNRCYLKPPGDPTNYGTRDNCDRASQDAPVDFPLCDEYYGIYLVKIKVLRLRKRRNSCNSKNQYYYDEHCFPIFVMPTIPPGLELNTIPLQTVFTCDNGTSATLYMDPNEPNQDGVCWSEKELLNTNENCFNYGSYSYQAKSDIEKYYTARYFKDYKYCPDSRIYGPEYTFKVIPASAVPLEAPDPILITTCKSTCRDVVVSKGLIPSYSQIKREVLWYKTALDQGEEPFHRGDSLLDENGKQPCFNNNTTYFISFRDTNPSGECPPRESSRTAVNILVIDDFLDLNNNTVIEDFQQEYISDNRNAQPAIDCTTDDSYNVELENIIPEDIEEILNNEISNDPDQNIRGYHYKVTTASLKWFKVNTENKEIDYDSDNNIYKKYGNRILVCAENTGISEGDYSTSAIYRGRLTYAVEIYNSDNELVDVPNCVEQRLIEKKINLRRSTNADCKSQFKLLEKQLADGWLTLDCNTSEAISVCPENSNEKEIGLEPSEAIEILKGVNRIKLPVTVFLQHTWTPTEGLNTPEKTRTTTNYDEIVVADNTYETYILSMNLGTGGPIQNQLTAVKHCSFVFKCPSCEIKPILTSDFN